MAAAGSAEGPDALVGAVELRAHAGTQFDPDVVEAFLRVLDRRGFEL